jgi:hypothetical protein
LVASAFFVFSERRFEQQTEYFTCHGASMDSHLTHSQGPRGSAIEPAHDAMHPGRGVIDMPTHDEIANRAYGLYVKSGRKQGQCNQNWHQAEVELRMADQRA